MKKIIIIFIIAFLILPVFAKKIIILHTNDTHGTWYEQEASFINPDFPPLLGGVYSFSTAVKWERKKAEQENNIVLLLESGNFVSKKMKENTVDFDKAIKIFNYLDYDAINLGLDELFGGLSCLKNNIDKFNMPVLLGNINIKNDFLNTKKYTIIEKEGVRVGVFGLTTEYALFNLSDRVLNDFEILGAIEEAKNIVNTLKDLKCDIIIALTSIGFENDKKLADKVDGIDVILGGYEGWGLKKAYETPINHTIIFRNYGDLSSFGKITLDLDYTNGIKKYEGKSVTLFEEEFPVDYKLKEIINN